MERQRFEIAGAMRSTLAAIDWQHTSQGERLVQKELRRTLRMAVFDIEGAARPNQKITPKRMTECGQTRYPDPKTSPVHETGPSSNRIRATEPPLTETGKDFCNKIGTKCECQLISVMAT
jgi:hypothetical protein